MLPLLLVLMSRLMESSASDEVDELEELVDEWQPLGKTPESEEDADDEDRSSSLRRVRPSGCCWR